MKREPIRGWETHRFDPAPPLLTASRPNPFGWVLIIGGLVGLGLLTLGRSHWGDLEWWQWLSVWAGDILFLAAGLRLLRPMSRRRR